MEQHEIVVRAMWDAEASVWVAESDDVPGLATEAPSMEELVAKLEVMIPELFELNGVSPPAADEIPFWIMAKHTAKPPKNAA